MGAAEFLLLQSGMMNRMYREQVDLIGRHRPPVTGSGMGLPPMQPRPGPSPWAAQQDYLSAVYAKKDLS